MNWAEVIGLTITITSLLVGLVWWMSALFHQVKAAAGLLSDMRGTLDAEFGCVRDGQIVEGRQTRNHRELNERVDILDGRVLTIEHSIQ